MLHNLLKRRAVSQKIQPLHNQNSFSAMSTVFFATTTYLTDKIIRQNVLF